MHTFFHSTSLRNQPGRIPYLTVIWTVLIMAWIIVCSFVNLEYAPATWFDEGSHLHVPKTIVQDGVYADKSAEGYRYHGPTIGIGPTIMLPVAAVFSSFGIGILQGRVVIVIYALLGLLAWYILIRRLFGNTTALLAVTLLLASRTVNYAGWVEYSRQVLGEVPGMAFFFSGILAWWYGLQSSQQYQQHATLANRRRYWRWSILAGIGFGFTLVTKNQFVLIIPPALTLLALLDWRYYRAGNWVLRLVPLGLMLLCFGAWVFIQFEFLGPGTFFENLQQTRQAAGGAIFVFYLPSTLRAARYLLQPDLYGGLLIPALGYAAWQMRVRSAAGLVEALFVLLIGLWLGWYTFVSLGWPRYAFPAVALSAGLVARFMLMVLAQLRQCSLRLPAYLFVAYCGLAILLPVSLTIRMIASPDDSAQRFAAVLDAEVPYDAIVETWDPEIGVLTNHRFNYPPQPLLDAAVRAEWLGQPIPDYDWNKNAPPYLAIGPFGSYTEVYDIPVLHKEYDLVAKIGLYQLYRRR